MTIELRNYYSDEYIRNVAESLANISQRPEIAKEFTNYVLDHNWCDKSLKERMHHLTYALYLYLDNDYKIAISTLKQLLLMITTGTYKHEDMLAMFIPNYVEQYGLAYWRLSMDALEFFTSNGTTSEFAIRPFIRKHPTRTMEQMLHWSEHKHEHVRRFASEGCRPKLPWAGALNELRKDPKLILPILSNLRADESLFVRRSVANNLNDISKDHPKLVLSLAQKWQGEHINTNWLIKHACRTLLKSGDQDTLSIFGITPVTLRDEQLTLSDKVITLGQRLGINFTAKIVGGLPKKIRMEYAIDFKKSYGQLSRKIFWGKEFVPTTDIITMNKMHHFIPLTTRRHYPGIHQVAIIINGHEVITYSFELVINP